MMLNEINKEYIVEGIAIYLLIVELEFQTHL